MSTLKSKIHKLQIKPLTVQTLDVRVDVVCSFIYVVTTLVMNKPDYPVNHLKQGWAFNLATRLW